MNPFQTAVKPAFSSAAFGPLKYSSITAPMGLTDDNISLVTTFSYGGVRSPSNCLSVNTILTLITGGVDVCVGVGVFVDVNDGVIVGVLLGVCEGVTVTVADGVKVEVLEGVVVAVGISLGVVVGVNEGVTVAV